MTQDNPVIAGVCDVSFFAGDGDEFISSDDQYPLFVTYHIGAEGADMLRLDGVAIAQYHILPGHIEQCLAHLRISVVGGGQLAYGFHRLGCVAFESVCLGKKLFHKGSELVEITASLDEACHRSLRVSQIGILQGGSEGIEVDALHTAVVIDHWQYVGRVLWLSVASCLHIKCTWHIAGHPMPIVHTAVACRYLAAVDKTLVIGLAEEVHFVDVVPLAATHTALVVVAVIGTAEKFTARVCPVLDEGVPSVPVV